MHPWQLLKTTCLLKTFFESAHVFQCSVCHIHRVLQCILSTPGEVVVQHDTCAASRTSLDVLLPPTGCAPTRTDAWMRPYELEWNNQPTVYTGNLILFIIIYYLDYTSTVNQNLTSYSTGIYGTDTSTSHGEYIHLRCLKLTRLVLLLVIYTIIRVVVLVLRGSLVILCTTYTTGPQDRMPRCILV